MKVPVLSVENEEIAIVELPGQFNESISEDLVKRAVLAMQSRRRQPYGASPDAGKRASAKLSRRRRHYKGSYGIGISRVPRKIISHRGRRFNWVGAFAPGTVGGRRAHPPKAGRIWEIKINEKERRKAIRSAMAASVRKEVVSRRGHKTPEIYPFAVESKIENVDRTKNVFSILKKLGLGNELARASEKKVRSGKGKMRGRKYKTKKGPLIIVSGNCKLVKAARNIPGVDVVEARKLNAELLAPGTSIGRLSIYTQGAIERIGKERMFE